MALSVNLLLMSFLSLFKILIPSYKHSESENKVITMTVLCQYIIHGISVNRLKSCIFDHKIEMRVPHLRDWTPWRLPLTATQPTKHQNTKPPPAGDGPTGTNQACGTWQEFGYSGLAYCRVAALPHQREPVNMVQGSNYSAHWKPPKQRCLTYAHLILDTMETEIDGC